MYEPSVTFVPPEADVYQPLNVYPVRIGAVVGMLAIAWPVV